MTPGRVDRESEWWKTREFTEWPKQYLRLITAMDINNALRKKIFFIWKKTIPTYNKNPHKESNARKKRNRIYEYLPARPPPLSPATTQAGNKNSRLPFTWRKRVINHIEMIPLAAVTSTTIAFDQDVNDGRITKSTIKRLWWQSRCDDKV